MHIEMRTKLCERLRFAGAQEFLQELTELQVEPAAAVRKYLAELLADAAAAAPRPAVLAPAAACLAALAADTTAAVAKAAISAAVAVFRIAFAITAHQALSRLFVRRSADDSASVARVLSSDRESLLPKAVLQHCPGRQAAAVAGAVRAVERRGGAAGGGHRLAGRRGRRHDCARQRAAAGDALRGAGGAAVHRGRQAASPARRRFAGRFANLRARQIHTTPASCPACAAPWSLQK